MRTVEPELQPNEVAANGPLPGDVSLYENELRCCEGLSTPGYYPSLNGAEIADAQRSAVFPCATFTGSYDGPNRVFAWRSEDTYQGTSYVNNRKPGELFILGGDFPPLKGPVPPGPYVAKADATTGAQIWRTYLDNANLSGQFIAALNLNILADGNVVVAWTDKIALLDGDTGRILKVNGALPPVQASHSLRSPLTRKFGPGTAIGSLSAPSSLFGTMFLGTSSPSPPQSGDGARNG